MPSIEVCIDVPSLEDARRFYVEAFGLVEEPSPATNVVIVTADNLRLCLLLRAEGSRPFPSAEQPRRYDRHWTPVHLDVRVSDIEGAVARAVAAGAAQETPIRTDEHGSWVSCVDPFGHGFCFIQPRTVAPPAEV